MKYLIFRADQLGADSCVGGSDTFEGSKEKAHKYVESVDKDDIPSCMQIMNVQKQTIHWFDVERIITIRLIDA